MYQKVAFVGVLLLLLVFLFGCTSQANGVTEQKFTSLRETYNATNAYPVNDQQLNDYITGLSLLRKGDSSAIQKIIDTELYSAQGFRYLLSAMNSSDAITASRASCTTAQGKQYITFAKLSVVYATKAVAAAGALSVADLEKLRPQQKEMAQNYLDQSSALVAGIEKVCGKV